jgi:membrane-associated protein
VIGGALWAAGVTALGHWLGRFHVIGNNIELIAVLIVLISFIPIGIEYLRGRRRRRAASPASPSSARDAA